MIIVLLHMLVVVHSFESGDCPGECHCTMDGNLMLVDCSGLEMYEFPTFPDNQIHMLDLSNNYFTQIPTQLDSFIFLQYLDMSENRIQKLKPNSLKGLITLGMLNLSKNNISSWTAINPRTLLEPAVSLRELSLAGNPLTSFTTNDENLLLVSNTLQLLDLSNCKITKVSGQQILQGMKELKHLILSGNQIRSISDIISDTLLTLDLSNNRLTNLNPTMLKEMPSLTSLNLAKNHRISLESKQGEFVTSESLRRIDLSFCNMDRVELEGFPALTTAILKGNMIRQLTAESFINNQMLENLDLSQNSINSIDANSFRKLKHLKTINLSFNMIPKIDRDTFRENELLTKLDLSRNYISRFSRLLAPQLTFLNMTWCEIMTIDHDAFSGFQELVEIDLSNNLIIDFPDTLSSDTLRTLDLSMNRMTTIRNFTFSGFPEISKINLSGNRFTTPFRIDYFAANPYLNELHLGDNPWQCNCPDMYAFYNFITEPPARLWEKQTLRCQSPESVSGRTWESACYFVWYPQSTMGTTEKIWTFFMITVIAFSGCMCLIMTIKRGIEGREQTRREQERERNIEEGREIIRQNRLRMQQEAQRDAPDPRESRPPCYSDAIRMPRLDASFASLNEFGRGKNKRRRKTETEDDDEINEEVPLRRNRCRSEEILSMRSTMENTTIVPRVHPFEGEMRDSRRETEESFEEIRNFNQSNNTLENGSPYSKRKQTAAAIASANRQQQQQQNENAPGPSTQQPIVINEDHFKNDDKSDSIEEREGSNEFITFEIKRQTEIFVPRIDNNENDDENIRSRPTSL
ncbi:hypothetical protein PVAND_009077 [Polypedilum vanderplanki]|uniref:Uncharacterized protein n=1 Tax=Polypedilum vanderplanki TaxID=319348 RepID=A0A9J6CBS6_POLVA|nr:hypothetical protein PVAND_009077 [Polypedilum vanderplanki]